MSCVFLFQLTGQAAFDVLSNHVSRTISNNNVFGACGRFPESRSGRLKLNKIGKFSISARSCVCAHAQRSEIWLISTEFYRANSQDSVFCLKVDVFLLTHAFVASFWDQIRHAEHHIQHRPATTTSLATHRAQPPRPSQPCYRQLNSSQASRVSNCYPSCKKCSIFCASS